MSFLIIFGLFGSLATAFVAFFAKDINSLYKQWKIKKKIRKEIRTLEKLSDKSIEFKGFCEKLHRNFKELAAYESQSDEQHGTIEDDIPLISEPYKHFTRLNEVKSDEEVFSEVEQVIKKFEL